MPGESAAIVMFAIRSAVRLGQQARGKLDQDQLAVRLTRAYMPVGPGDRGGTLWVTADTPYVAVP